MNRTGIHPVTPAGNKEIGRYRSTRPVMLTPRDVGCEHLACRGMQRNESRLSELRAADRQYRLRQINVLKLEIARFTQAHARDAQQPEQAVIGPWQQCSPFIVVWHLQRRL